jgi:hypothetical protein
MDRDELFGAVDGAVRGFVAAGERGWGVEVQPSVTGGTWDSVDIRVFRQGGDELIDMTTILDLGQSTDEVTREVDLFLSGCSRH